MDKIDKIKYLLERSEIALAKVEYNHNGTKIINPRQQAASNRLYTLAYRIANELNIHPLDFAKIHSKVITQMENKH